MLKFLNHFVICTGLVATGANMALAEDIKKGEKVYKKCAACHAVGEGAGNKVGPHLNDMFGRTAGTIEGFKYSKAMIKAGEEGLVWNDETLNEFLKKPKKFMKGTKMSFNGLKKDKQRVNLLAYLKTFSSGEQEGADTKADETSGSEAPTGADESTDAAAQAPKVLAKDTKVPSHGVLHLGRAALKEEVAAWDIDIRPDGKGLPVGKGTVAQGEPLYQDQCAVCHGDFGEGVDRWPVLAGGHDTLTEERPEKTIGSYWPYLSTVYDYVRRAMPFGNARSLSDDDVYAITAYLLYLNDVVEDEGFELSNENFNDIKLPNEPNFIPDSRFDEPQYATKGEPCMKSCIEGEAKVIMHARILDVTPDGEGEGGID